MFTYAIMHKAIMLLQATKNEAIINEFIRNNYVLDIHLVD